MLHRPGFLVARNGCTLFSSCLPSFGLSSLKRLSAAFSTLSTSPALARRQSALVFSPVSSSAGSHWNHVGRSFAASTSTSDFEGPAQKTVLAKTPGGKTVERPISPHITIYNFPFTAFTSGMHRVTGIALSGGFGAVAWMALFGSCDVSSWVCAFQTAAPALVYPVKMMIAFPLCYHFTTGMRHMLWDKTAEGLDLQQIDRSNKIIVAVAAGFTLFFTVYSL